MKRGELKFNDVIKSMGSGAALSVFDQEDRSLAAKQISGG